MGMGKNFKWFEGIVIDKSRTESLVPPLAAGAKAGTHEKRGKET
jgi:hypothetical protein